MVAISPDLDISRFTVKIAELTELSTKKEMKIEEITGIQDVIYAYSVTLGDTEIAQGAVVYGNHEYAGGWVPVLRVTLFEGDFGEALSRWEVQGPKRRYRTPLEAVEKLDIMLSCHLADEYR